MFAMSTNNLMDGSETSPRGERREARNCSKNGGRSGKL